MASALWVMRRCHLVRGQKMDSVRTFNSRRCRSVIRCDGLRAYIIWSETVGAISS